MRFADRDGSLTGKPLDSKTLEGALDVLASEFDLPFDVPGGAPRIFLLHRSALTHLSHIGMSAFRRTLTLSFAYKFFISAAFELGISLDSIGKNLDSEITDSIHRQISTSSRDNSDPYALETVGRQFPHSSGLKHVTGEAVYVDDMPSVGNEAFAGLVLSTRAHAKILKVDPSAALEQEGVLAFVDHRDLPNERANYWGSAAIDEVFFAVDEVVSHGQIIGAVVAKNRIIASKAAKLVRVEYEDLPVVLTIEEVSCGVSACSHLLVVVLTRLALNRLSSKSRSTRNTTAASLEEPTLNKRSPSRISFSRA